MTSTAVSNADAMVEALTDIATHGNAIERCIAIASLTRLPHSAAYAALLAARLDEDEDVRADAVSALSDYGGPEVEDPILDSLTRDPVHEVKLAAIESLGKLRARRAVPLLCRLARERTDEVLTDVPEPEDDWDDWLDIQLKAITALGEIGDEACVEHIVAAMTDEFAQDLWPVGLTALTKLGDRGMSAAIDLLKVATNHAREQVAAKLTAAGQSLPPKSAEVLANDASPGIRALSVSLLDPSSEQAQKLVRDPAPQVRVKAIEHYAEVMPHLINHMLDDVSEDVQAAAIRALIRHPEALEISPEEVVERFGLSQSPDVCCAVLDFLNQHAPDDASQTTNRLCRSRRAPLAARRRAICLLRRVGGEDRLAMLSNLIADPLRPIRLEAIGTLASIATYGADTSPGDADRAASILIDALQGRLIAPAISSGGSSVRKDDSENDLAAMPSRQGADAAVDDNAARQNKIRIDEDGNIVEIDSTQQTLDNNAGEAPRAKADPPFPTSTLDVIQGSDGRVPPAGLKECNIALSEEDLGFLALTQTRVGRKASSVNDPIPVHKDARVLAARTLGTVPREDVVLALVETLDDNDTELRAASASALAKIIPKVGRVSREVVEALGRQVKDSVLLVRLGIVRALAAADNPDATPFLMDATADAEPSIQAEALQALSRRPNCSFDFDEFLRAPSDTVRSAAALSVARVQGIAASEKLFSLAFKFEGVHARALALVLYGLDPVATQERLIEVIRDDTNRKARLIAIGMLGEIAEASVS